MRAENRSFLLNVAACQARSPSPESPTEERRAARADPAPRFPEYDQIGGKKTHYEIGRGSDERHRHAVVIGRHSSLGEGAGNSRTCTREAEPALSRRHPARRNEHDHRCAEPARSRYRGGNAGEYLHSARPYLATLAPSFAGPACTSASDQPAKEHEPATALTPAPSSPRKRDRARHSSSRPVSASREPAARHRNVGRREGRARS